jgi:hypothetical protein
VLYYLPKSDSIIYYGMGEYNIDPIKKIIEIENEMCSPFIFPSKSKVTTLDTIGLQPNEYKVTFKGKPEVFEERLIGVGSPFESYSDVDDSNTVSIKIKTEKLDSCYTFIIPKELKMFSAGIPITSYVYTKPLTRYNAVLSDYLIDLFHPVLLDIKYIDRGNFLVELFSERRISKRGTIRLNYSQTTHDMDNILLSVNFEGDSLVTKMKSLLEINSRNPFYILDVLLNSEN